MERNLIVTIYTQPACLLCKYTSHTLGKLGISYLKIDVISDEKARDYIVGLGYTQLPVGVTSDSESWSGFRDEKLRAIKVCA